MTELNLNDAVLEMELVTDSAPVEAELDFKGEIIRADAEALEKEYNKGYEKGQTEGYDKGNAEGYKQGHTEGYNEGALPMYYADNLSFGEVVFPENTNLTVRVRSIYTMNGMFSKASGLRSVKLIHDTTKTLQMVQFVRENKDLLTLDLSEFNGKPSSVDYFALLSPKLKSIYGALDFSECTSAAIWLNGANALEDISFVPQTIKISIDFYWCAYLTPASVQSIINGLADLTGKASQNVSFHSSILRSLTAEQYQQILNKNWTYS